MKEWQFNILFFVGVGSALFLLLGPEFGLDISTNPTALAGVGSILTYILTQRKSFTKGPETKRKKRRHESENEEDDPRIDSVYTDPNEEEGR